MTKRFQNGIPSKKSSPHKTVVLVISILLLFAIAAGIYYWFAIRGNNTTIVDKNSDDPTISSAKKSGGKVSATKPGGSNTTSDQVPVDESLAIGTINFTQQNGTVSASAQINGSGQEGTCVFSFTSTDSRPVVKESKGTTTCSINASENEFDKIGEWELEVTFYSQDNKTSGGRKVTIN